MSRAADLAIDRLLPAVRARPRTAGRRQARWLHKRLSAAVADGELLPAADAGRVLALIGIHDLRDVAWGGMTRAVAGAHAVEAPWQEMAENGVDSAHFRYVHNTAEVPGDRELRDRRSPARRCGRARSSRRRAAWWTAGSTPSRSAPAWRSCGSPASSTR